MFLVGGGYGCGSDGRGIFFDGHAELEKGAIVPGGFFRDGLGNRLGTLELRASIEVHAHFAAVDFIGAAWARAMGIEPMRQNIAASSAARVKDGADHARSAWADLFLARRAGMLLFLGPLFAFFGLAGILVAVLPIFSVQTNLSGIHWNGAGCTQN